MMGENSIREVTMIHELRTYTLKPGNGAEVEARFEKSLPARVKHSKLGGFWHTEVGPLNQVLHTCGHMMTWPTARRRVRRPARRPTGRRISGSS